MNRAYRLIWNESLHVYVPAPEWVRARGKCARSVRAFATVATVLAVRGALAAEPSPTALPTGGQVVSGHAALTRAEARLDIHQTSDRAIIDWQRFDIGRDATVSFWQPSSSSIALNRVLSADPSAIFGQLNANGRVFLSNPNGVLFGGSARVDVGGLVATSMQIDPDDFIRGRFSFSRGAGEVVNQGVITAADGGFLALMAPQVRNEGVLRAHLGTVAMAAGEATTLHFEDNRLLGVQVDPATIDVLLENRHLIQADGGRVILSASAAQRLIDQVIPGSGGATRLVAENGAVRLVNVEGAVQADAIAIDGGGAGITRVAGILDATSSNGAGGNILVTGDKVLVDAGASIDASGPNAGTVLVGGDQQGANPNVRNAQRLFIDAAATVRADGIGSSNGGRVIAYSSEGTQIYGALTARAGALGGDGGFIETSGGWLDIGRVPDASAPAGHAGAWLIDPFDITIQAAGADTSMGTAPNWQSTANNAILTTGSLQSALNAGTSVTITTGSGGAQGGDIEVIDPIVKSAGGDASLTLNAHRDIVLDAPISSTSGALSLAFDADINNDLAGSVVFNSNLTTLGGAVTFHDGVIMGGTAAQTIDTTGGVGGNVTFSSQVLIGNTNGVTISTGGGNVLFSSLLDSANDYTFVAGTATWTAARTAAASGTGANIGDTYLATTTSPLEMSRAASIAGYQSAWLGGSDAASEATWRWVTGPEGLEESGQGRIFFVGNRSGAGTPLTGFNGFNGAYVNWNGGEPNDAGGEDALQLGFGPAGQWNDFPINSNTLPYVVETNLAASPLTLNVGSGNVTFNGAVGSGKALGTLTVNGSGNVLLNTNTVNVAGNINLNAGGNVILGATNSPVLFADDGHINVARGILKNAGADAALTLRADGDILLSNSADVTSTSNRLAVTFNSDRDASGGGAILLGNGSVVTSNGGNVTLRGGLAALGAVNDPTVDAAAFLTTLSSTGARGSGGYGIDLLGASLAAGGGNIELRGVGDSGFSGVRIAAGSTVTTTGTGQVALYGVGGSAGTTNSGVNVTGSGATVSTQNGELRIHGLGRGTNTNAGVLIDTYGGGSAATVSSVDGNIVVRGANTATGTQDRGIFLDTNPIVRTTGAGNIDFVGRGSGTGSDGTGVQLLNDATVQTTGSGGISMTGFGSAGGTLSNNEGVKVEGSLVEVQGGAGDLVLDGFGGTGQSFNIGVNVRVSGVVRMGSNALGDMIITGTGGNGSVTGNWGVLAELDAVYESLGAAPIRLIGIGGTGADNHGIKLTGGNNNRIGSSTMTGDITLTADTMDLQGTGIIAVRSSGNLVIEPFAAGTTIGLGNGATGVLNLNATELSRLTNGFSQITIGRSDGTGAIDVEAGTFSDSIRLLNTGIGSGGIHIDGVLNTGVNQLWLSSAGPVTQSAGITASQLLLTGAGPFTLTNAANSVVTLAGAVGGNLSFTNNGSLTVGALTGGGTPYNGIANSGGTVLLTAGGTAADLTLQQAISATGGGTSLQLVAGRNFINAAGAAALDAGLGRWLVWSTNPANDTRGGLVYDFKHYGATHGITVPGQVSGDGFLYTFAPTVTVSLSDISRTYDGTIDATLSSADFTVDGAIDGDTVAVSTPTSGTFDTKDAGTGKTVTAAGIAITSTSNGAATVYGYQLASASASNTASVITPRALTITADDSTRTYGDANPTFTAGYSGFVTGEDQSVLGGALAFVTPATLASDIGDYSIAPVGLTSTNYAISYVNGTLTVTPAALVVTADNQVKVYGDTDPALTYTVGGAGLRNGDMLSGSLLAPIGAEATAGSHAISQGSLAADANYTMTFTPGTLTVSQAPLLVSADDLARAVFTDNPPLTATLTGLRYNDDASVLSGLTLSTNATTESPPGTYAIQAGGATAANYSITHADGQLEVVARSALAEVPNVQNVENLVTLETPAVIQLGVAPGPLAGESNLSNVIVDGGIALSASAASRSAATSMSGGFVSVEPLSDVEMTPQLPVRFGLPADTFRHADPDAAVEIFALSADGSPLPEGLSFDPASGVLFGTPPADREEVDVLFVARDALGSEARAHLKLRTRRR